MNKHPLISVIVAVYYSEKYLDRCIQTIINQTYQNMDIVLVVDGEMKDRSEEICQEYSCKDYRIRVIKIVHSGLPEVRNVGVDNARGEIIAFVDADDWLEDTAFEKMIDAMIENNSDMVMCAYYVDMCRKQYVNGIIREDHLSPYDALHMLFRGDIQNFMWNKIYNRKLFCDIRFLSDRLVDDIGVMHLLIDKSNRIDIVNEPLYHYVKNEGSIISGRNTRVRIDMIELWIRQYEFILDHYPEMEKDIIRTLRSGYVSLAYSSVISSGCDRMSIKERRARASSFIRNRMVYFEREMSSVERVSMLLLLKNRYFMDVAAIVIEALRRLFAIWRRNVDDTGSVYN